MQQHLDRVVAMTVDARRSCQRGGQGRSGSGPGCRGAAAVVTMAREAAFGVNRTSAIEAALLLGTERRTVTPRTATRRIRRIEDSAPAELVPARRGGLHRRLDDGESIRNFQNVDRQQCLD